MSERHPRQHVNNTARSFRHVDMNELRRLHALGKTDPEIGESMGFPVPTIRRARNRVELPVNLSPRLDVIDPEEVKRLHALRMTDRQIAEVMGFMPDSIQRVRKRLHLPLNPASREHVGGSKRKYDYDLIKSMLKMNVPTDTIRSEVGCGEHPIAICRKELGMSTPHPAKKLAPLSERLEQAEDMILNQHASFADVVRTTHVNRKLLVKKFPGHQWTPQEAGAHAMTVRWGERKLNETYPSSSKSHLTRPPLSI